MRIAIISDIHGNYTALQRVLADIEQQHVDSIVCLGDTITLGPQPLEVLAALRGLNCTFIKGNHDSAVICPELAAQYEITDYLIPDLKWCRSLLSEADLDLLDSFLPAHEMTLANGTTLLFFHGSPQSPTDIIEAATPTAALDEFFRGQTADVLIGGHSHVQMYRRHGEKLIINPGSVGNAFKFTYTPGNPPSLLPWAEYTILGQNGPVLDVDLRRVPFDTAEVHQRVRESGLHGKEWWLRQYQP